MESVSLKESLVSVTLGGFKPTVGLGPPRWRWASLPIHLCPGSHPRFLSDSSTGIVASNTRDNNTGATYPHLNFSIPITVLQPALQRYSQTGDMGGLRELDHTAEPVRVVWRLQRPLAEAPRSKL